MFFEKKSWREAIDFLADFAQVAPPINKNAENKIRENLSNLRHLRAEKENKAQIEKITEPNNEELLNYFQKRGIDGDILKNFAKQVHFEMGGKRQFALGIENESGGFELRNEFFKTKIGKSNFSIIDKISGNETSAADLLVFEGMTDAFSFLQCKKIDGDENDKTLVSLNSITNAEKFIEYAKSKIQNSTFKIYLCLDGDKAGNETAEKIKNKLQNIDVQDIRNLFDIAENKNKDFNDYLKLVIRNEELVIRNEELVIRNEKSEAELRQKSFYHR